MRLRSVTVKGLTTFHERASVDFVALGQIVAIVGENGQGKTTLLESAYAALYRSWASRDGNLCDEARGRDAYVEAIFDGAAGQEWTARLSVDAERRKIEQHLLLNGRPVTTGKAGEVADAVTKAFGSKALILASVFSAQNREGNFAGLGRGDRKALFVEALGLARLDALAKGARDRSAALLVKGAPLRADAERLLQLEAKAAAMDLEEREAIQKADAAEVALSACSLNLQRAHESAAQYQAALARYQEIEAAARLAEANYERAADRSRASRSALEQQQAAVATRSTRLKARISALVARSAELELEPTAVVDLDAARARVRDLVEDGKGAAAVLERANVGEREASAEYTAATRALAKAEAETIAEEKRRAALTEQAVLLQRVPCAAQTSWFRPEPPCPACETDPGDPFEECTCTRPAPPPVDLAGTCPLLAGAKRAEVALASDAPDILAAPQERALAASKNLTDARNAVSVAAETYKLAQDAWKEAQGALNAEEQAERRAGEVARNMATVAADLAIARQEELDSLSSDCEALEAAGALNLTAAKELEETQRQAAETRSALAGARSSLEDAQHAHAALAEASEGLERAKAEERACSQRLTAINTTIKGLLADMVLLASSGEQLVAVNEEISDWNLLSEALGKDGLQALEIDAAGPGVAEICNELLTTCYGPRFSLRFETLRQNRTTDGAQEVFDIIAIDNGVERRIEKLSGGEQVIVREALALALAIWNARRSGVKWRTLFRDETSGALSPANAVAYVGMLRRALDLGGFAQVMFVAHQPEVWARADSRIIVHDGTAEVEA